MLTDMDMILKRASEKHRFGGKPFASLVAFLLTVLLIFGVSRGAFWLNGKLLKQRMLQSFFNHSGCYEQVANELLLHTPSDSYWEITLEDNHFYLTQNGQTGLLTQPSLVQKLFALWEVFSPERVYCLQGKLPQVHFLCSYRLSFDRMRQAELVYFAHKPQATQLPKGAPQALDTNWYFWQSIYAG